MNPQETQRKPKESRGFKLRWCYVNLCIDEISWVKYFHCCLQGTGFTHSKKPKHIPWFLVFGEEVSHKTAMHKCKRQYILGLIWVKIWIVAYCSHSAAYKQQHYDDLMGTICSCSATFSCISLICGSIIFLACHVESTSQTSIGRKIWAPPKHPVGNVGFSGERQAHDELIVEGGGSADG